jgi:hypothetical protein
MNQTVNTPFLQRAMQLMRRRWLALSIIAAVLFAYAVFGFWGVPRIVQSQLKQYVEQTLHRQVSVGDVHFNPFTFEIRIDNFALREQDGSALVAFKLLRVNAELASLWQRRINLKEVQLDAPDVNVVIDAARQLNLAKLAPASSDTQQTSGPPPRIRIGQLTVTQGRVALNDLSTDKPVHIPLQPIQFSLTEFKTDLNYGNVYRFAAETEGGGRLQWSGEFTVQPLGSFGQFSIEQLQASTLAAYLDESLPFQLLDGQLSLQGNYKIAVNSAEGDPLQLDLKLATLGIQNLSVAEKNATAAMIKIPAIVVNDVVASYGQRSVDIASVSVASAAVELQREKDGAMNVSRLFTPATPMQSSSTSSQPTQSSDASVWRVKIADTHIKESAVVFVDATVTPAARFVLKPVSIQISNLGTAKEPMHLLSDVVIDQNARIKVDGDINVEPLQLVLNTELNRFALPSVQSYLDQHAHLAMRSGFLSAQGKLEYGQVQSPAKKSSTGEPKLAFVGGISVDELGTADKPGGDDFVMWKRVAAKGINVVMQGDALSLLNIDSIVAQQPYARVLIAADRTMNVSNILSSPAESMTTESTQASANPKSSSKDTQPQIRIKNIKLIDGSANFSDRSIQPNFAAGVVELNGSITGLSSQPASRAVVDLQGKVDRYAPVEISGEMNMLSADRFSDVKLKFANMELTTFNPYSGKFAGYNITKGKLSTELRYRVQDRKLDAQHHLIVDNLEFGDKTDSKDAAPVPVKFAIALLKDRNGIIDLELPVAGTLDDPEFRVGPLVWRACMGLLRKAVTSPFAALGALFGGGDELAMVEFAPGSAELTATEVEKLGKVSKGLIEKNQLKLNIPLNVASDLDANALAQQALQSLAPATDVSAGKRRLAALESEYKNRAGQTIVYPATEGAEPATKLSADQILESKIAAAEAALLPLLKPNVDTLNDLARRRANAVQTQVLSGGEIAAERVFLVNESVRSDKAVESGELVKMEMQLE